MRVLQLQAAAREFRQRYSEIELSEKQGLSFLRAGRV